MRGEKSAITRIGQKPDVGRRSPSKGHGQGHIQMERNQSENSGRRSTSQLTQNPTRGTWTARVTQNKNKEFYRVGKVWPHYLPTRLGEHTKERATTKSAHSCRIGGLQSTSSATRGLSIAVAQTSKQGIKDIVL